MSLLQAVVTLPGVGAALSEKLSRLNIQTLQDLLLHFPMRYEDRTRITPISQVKPYSFVVIEGNVIAANIQFGKRRSLLVDVEDSRGAITLRFFHFNRTQQQQFTVNKKIRCIGEVRYGTKALEMIHPEYSFNPTDLPQNLTPVYSMTDGVSQIRLRKLIQSALARLDRYDLPLILPDEIAQKITGQTQQTGKSLSEIIRFLHAPPTGTDIELLSSSQHPMVQLLIAEELLAHQLSLIKVKQRQHQLQASSLEPKTNLIQHFLNQLPFTPTNAQSRCFEHIASDLAQSYPMQRLLQGDVGSGKTLVACLSILTCIDNDMQAVLMAPTEILAQQHFYVLSQWLAPLGIMPIILTGKMTAKQKRNTLDNLKNKESLVIVGTHALVQQGVTFSQLGLVIIDEQHRFGVNQRLALNDKNQRNTHFPHQLIMTATPIPRTLAMSYYGNLDISIIDELPPGRKPVITTLINARRRDKIIARVDENCRNGVQVYWVCTLIEESDVLQSRAAEDTAQQLQQALPHLTVGLIHGRLKGSEKNSIMQQFKQGDIHLLVATTVIEVGVDVPNASLMIIENPERLGLSQLHQLRGRVGRGSTQSHCALLYSEPLSSHAKQRIGAMRDNNDGFKIAEIDLKLRGPGELLGVKQTGEVQFKLVDLQRDTGLLSIVRDYAMQNQQSPEVKTLTDQLINRWLPKAEHYSRG